MRRPSNSPKLVRLTFTSSTRSEPCGFLLRAGAAALLYADAMIATLSRSGVRRWLGCAGALLLAAGAMAAEIHDAVLAHDVERVRQLLLENPDLVNARTERGDTPLYIAAFRGYSKQMIPVLLQFGADPAPAPNDRLETPLSIARELNMKQAAGLLLRAGAKDDALSWAAEFRYATMKGDAAVVAAQAAAHPAVVNARNGFGQTPLMLAVAMERPTPNVITTLLTLGADPNATNNYGGTAYAIAVEHEKGQIAALLRERGGKETPGTRSAALRIAVRRGLLAEVETFLTRQPELVDATDDLRRTALFLACVQGSLPLVEALLRRAADVNGADFADNTPLHGAALAGNADLVKVLLAKGADPRRVTRQKVTPLLNAAASGSLPAVEALLAAGADARAVDNLGETALHRAAAGGHTELIRRLLELGLPVDVRDRQRHTPLHQAAERGRVEAVRLLLARGANSTLRDFAGLTPAELAEKRKQEEAAKILRAPAAK